MTTEQILVVYVLGVPLIFTPTIVQGVIIINYCISHKLMYILHASEIPEESLLPHIATHWVPVTLEVGPCGCSAYLHAQLCSKALLVISTNAPTTAMQVAAEN